MISRERQVTETPTAGEKYVRGDSGLIFSSSFLGSSSSQLGVGRRFEMRRELKLESKQE